MDSPLVKYVVPSVGCVLGMVMLLSPAKAVWHIRKTQKLGEVNPLPYPMTALNCLGWIIYGTVIADLYIGVPNVVGIIFGVFFTMTAFPACSRKMQDLMTGMFCFASVMFGALSVVHTFALDQAGRKLMWGLVAVIILMVYYLIPLSTMVEVIKKRDAASIYMPLACAAILNGSLWTIYGLAIGDINVWGPNAFGVVVGTVQVVLKLVFRAKKDAGAKEPPALPSPPNGPWNDESKAKVLLTQTPSFAGSSASAAERLSLTPESSVTEPTRPLGAHAVTIPPRFAPAEAQMTTLRQHVSAPLPGPSAPSVPSPLGSAFGKEGV